MRLSFNMEYFGECREVLAFYMAAFENASSDVKPYREMPTAEVLGIVPQGMDMVWQSELTIPFGEYDLNFELSDSLLVAMDRKLSFSSQMYNPVICIAHEDESHIRKIFEKIYGEECDFDRLKEGGMADRYGIQWAYDKSGSEGIFYSLTFDGFCSDVIAYYEIAFDVEAAEVVRYADSPLADRVSGEGGDKIYRAVLTFRHGDRLCALRLNDSLESAVNNGNSYDSGSLLFYHKFYNPIFVFRDGDEEYLTEAFDRLSVGAKLNKSLVAEKNGGANGSLIDKYGICWNFYSED